MVSLLWFIILQKGNISDQCASLRSAFLVHCCHLLAAFNSEELLFCHDAPQAAQPAHRERLHCQKAKTNNSFAKSKNVCVYSATTLFCRSLHKAKWARSLKPSCIFPRVHVLQMTFFLDILFFSQEPYMTVHVHAFVR